MTFEEIVQKLREKRDQVVATHNAFEAAKKAYKDESKALLGFCDGEAADVLELAVAIRKLSRTE